MANKVQKGPGQPEVTGDLANPRDSNPLGTYKDPESGAELEVTMGAGADALARLKWDHVKHLDAPAKAVPEAETLDSEPEEVAQPAPAPDANLDDADVVEDQQDNAAGHKVEGVDGAPGVPAGDPEELAEETAPAEAPASAPKAK